MYIFIYVTFITVYVKGCGLGVQSQAYKSDEFTQQISGSVRQHRSLYRNRQSLSVELTRKTLAFCKQADSGRAEEAEPIRKATSLSESQLMRPGLQLLKLRWISISPLLKAPTYIPCNIICVNHLILYLAHRKYLVSARFCYWLTVDPQYLFTN